MKQIKILSQTIDENRCVFEKRVNKAIEELDKDAEIIDIKIINDIYSINNSIDTDISVVIIYDKN